MRMTIKAFITNILFNLNEIRIERAYLEDYFHYVRGWHHKLLHKPHCLH